MLLNKTPLKIDEIVPRFSALLEEAGTALDNPSLDATWRAFAQFCQVPVICDDEKFLFEADLSPSQPDSFYVHFARTCYGREPKGHIWSHEVICDFLFPLDAALEEFQSTIELEEPVSGSDEVLEFIAQVQNLQTLWQTLVGHQPTQAQIYIGES